MNFYYYFYLIIIIDRKIYINIKIFLNQKCLKKKVIMI